MRQHTIAEKVSCTGTGLHSGEPVQMVLRPARAGSGIVFVRQDVDPRLEIPARANTLASTRYSTKLERNGVSIGTVEHILSALYGLGIDNARVEIDGPELPAMDGSAAPFVYLIRSAGLFRQREPRCVLRIRKSIEVGDGDRRIRIDPAPEFGVSYAIDFDHQAIRRQKLTLGPLDAERFEHQIAGARTFGFLREVDSLRQAGLALGGSLANTIVLDADAVMNPEGLRWPDEFVRHKILDLLGDLALLGAAVRGHIHIEKGGHTLHQRLVAAILDNPGSWRFDHPDAHITDPLADADLGFLQR